MRKKYKHQSSHTLKSKGSSSLNTTVSESKNQTEVTSHSQKETEELQTSLPALPLDNSGQSKLKEKEEDQANHNLTSSKESETMEEKQYSPTPWMKLLKRLTQVLFLIMMKTKNRPYRIVKCSRRKRRSAKPVTVFDKKLHHQIHRMAVTLDSQNWGMKLGISAPQVGINKRLFIMKGKIIINPEWNETKAPKTIVSESCYSVGKKIFKVPRAPYGWAKWQDSNGEWHEEKLKNLEAIIYQHELDHLNGLCCCNTGEEVK